MRYLKYLKVSDCSSRLNMNGRSLSGLQFHLIVAATGTLCRDEFDSHTGGGASFRRGLGHTEDLNCNFWLGLDLVPL